MKSQLFLGSLLLVTFFSANVFASQVTEDPVPKTQDIANPLLEEKHIASAIQDQDDNRIFRHKPVYFAYSNPLTKVQLSFRSALVDDIPLFFGYTQVIFWELGADSKPFLDATYNPEFFYRFSPDRDRLKTVDFGIWEHQSNGKSGADSRSFDQTYVKAAYSFEGHRWVTTLSGKLSFIYNNDETNNNISTYIGPLDLGLKFTQLYSGVIDKSEFIFNAHPGGKWATDWGKGGYEMTYSFRLGGLNVVPSFYIQYFTGYGETLLTYNKRQDQYRFGLLF
ncbi:MAG: phospholipase A [Bdellovibrionaceae bacterium]|nr:phospholipase A [Pseudobdellovibrionaceae bacterium]